MLAHLHTVVKLEESIGRLGWLQYDWRTRKELCAAHEESRPLAFPSLHTPRISFAGAIWLLIPLNLMSSQLPMSGGTVVRGKPSGSSSQGQPGHPSRHGGICRLFDRTYSVELPSSINFSPFALWTSLSAMIGPSAQRIAVSKNALFPEGAWGMKWQGGVYKDTRLLFHLAWDTFLHHWQTIWSGLSNSRQ